MFIITKAVMGALKAAKLMLFLLLFCIYQARLSPDNHNPNPLDLN